MKTQKIKTQMICVTIGIVAMSLHGEVFPGHEVPPDIIARNKTVNSYLEKMAREGYFPPPQELRDMVQYTDITQHLGARSMMGLFGLCGGNMSSYGNPEVARRVIRGGHSPCRQYAYIDISI